MCHQQKCRGKSAIEVAWVLYVGPWCTLCVWPPLPQGWESGTIAPYFPWDWLSCWLSSSVNLIVVCRWSVFAMYSFNSVPVMVPREFHQWITSSNMIYFRLGHSILPMNTSSIARCHFCFHCCPVFVGSIYPESLAGYAVLRTMIISLWMVLGWGMCVGGCVLVGWLYVESSLE